MGGPLSAITQLATPPKQSCDPKKLSQRGFRLLHLIQRRTQIGLSICSFFSIQTMSSQRRQMCSSRLDDDYSTPPLHVCAPPCVSSPVPVLCIYVPHLTQSPGPIHIPEARSLP